MITSILYLLLLLIILDNQVTAWTIVPISCTSPRRHRACFYATTRYAAAHPDDGEHQPPSSPQRIQHKRRRPRIPILQYHDDWVCINKPPGITVHRSKNTPQHQRVLTSSIKHQLSRKVFPVHRLDHRTSGALLLAFDSETAGKLHEAAIRKGQKQYVALLRGEWKYPSSSSLIVDKPLKVQNDIVKEARTNFTLLASTSVEDDTNDDNDNEFGNCSLVLCRPLTGRTHQIRRHAREIGHPIIGDSQHGDSKVNRFWRQERGMDRLALHCWTLAFDLNEERFECVAPVPKEIRTSLERFAPEVWERATQWKPELLMEEYDKRSGTHGRHFRQRQAAA